MDQRELIDALTKALASHDAVRGLFLGGSFGRGTNDEWSDVDFVIVAEADDHPALAEHWRHTLNSLVPIVFWQELQRGDLVINAISEEWLRCDTSLTTRDSFGRRAKNLVKPLIDRDGIYEALPDTLPPKTPDAGYVHYVIHEFIRMLGLMPVGAGRQEYVTMALGVGMMRGHLEGLLMQDVPHPDPGGMLHQSKLLSPDQMDLLRSLPYPRPDRDALIEANLAIAREFMPRARAMAQRLDIEWPEAFEAATRKRVRQTLGVEW